jgi:hypothetical protein
LKLSSVNPAVKKSEKLTSKRAKELREGKNDLLKVLRPARLHLLRLPPFFFLTISHFLLIWQERRRKIYAPKKEMNKKRVKKSESPAVCGNFNNLKTRVERGWLKEFFIVEKLLSCYYLRDMPVEEFFGSEK